jgi:hypothetical protein
MIAIALGFSNGSFVVPTVRARGRIDARGNLVGDWLEFLTSFSAES